MKVTRLILALVLLAGGSLGMASCPQRTGKPNPQALASLNQTPQVVHDERYGVALLVPPDWTISKKETNPVLFAMAPGATSYGPLANLVVEDVNQRMAAYDYLQANILAMRVSLPGLKVSRGGVEMAGGVSMAWIQFTYPRGEVLLEAIAYCQTRDYRAYVLTTIAPEFQFDGYEILFRTIGRSMRLE